MGRNALSVYRRRRTSALGDDLRRRREEFREEIVSPREEKCEEMTMDEMERPTQCGTCTNVVPKGDLLTSPVAPLWVCSPCYDKQYAEMASEVAEG